MDLFVKHGEANFATLAVFAASIYAVFRTVMAADRRLRPEFKELLAGFLAKTTESRDASEPNLFVRKLFDTLFLTETIHTWPWLRISLRRSAIISLTVFVFLVFVGSLKYKIEVS